VSDDTYTPAFWSDHDLSQYPCGVKAGSRLRLRKDLVVCDHEGKPTGNVHRAGGLWQAIEGISTEPSVVWLLQPDGQMHTWDDDDLLSWFVLESEPIP